MPKNISRMQKRKGISKIARLKTGHSMLIRVTKTKLTLKPPQNAPLRTGKVKETPEHFLLNCKKNMTQNEQN